MHINEDIPCIIFGASGYAGLELARLVQQHPAFFVQRLFVSEHSLDANKPLSELYPTYHGQLDFPLQRATQEAIDKTLDDAGKYEKVFIFLATPHEFSHDIATRLIRSNIVVFDLSGAFRLQDPSLYVKHYGFEHKYAELLTQTPYGLPEWNAEALGGKALVSLPGCYPTAAQLAIKPLIANALLQPDSVPVINAVSGVSGAGRKANLATSFCELSLKPYNLFTHRHAPEIAQGLGRDAIFTPHVADFKRGILATIVMKTNPGVTESDVNNAFIQAYERQPLVRLRNVPPAINDVAGTPFCDLYWQLNGTDLIVISAIDNLLKGAASQAIQCANLVNDWPQELGLLSVTHAEGA